MLVMIFGITPKRTVHELFGCHDTVATPYKSSKPGETTIGKDGFHCACEHQEFQTAFTGGIAPQYAALHFEFSKPADSNIAERFHSTSASHQLLRGPPALI